MPEIIQAIMTKNRDYARAKPITPIGILVHATGAVNSYLRRYVDCPDMLGANAYNNTWNRPGAVTSVHAFIGRDKDKRVIVAQTLPYSYACRGCGGAEKGSFNYDPVAHVQFEICEGGKADRAYFEQAMRVAADYCAYLCRLLGLGWQSIVSHKEAHALGYASNHDDPEAWMKHFGYDMDKFRAAVSQKMEQGGGEPMNDVLYQATINTKGDAGLSLWETSAKLKKVTGVAKGEVVDVLSVADSRGFCYCRYRGLAGWADGRYLQRIAGDGADIQAALRHLLSAQTALAAMQSTLAALQNDLAAAIQGLRAA